MMVFPPGPVAMLVPPLLEAEHTYAEEDPGGSVETRQINPALSLAI